MLSGPAILRISVLLLIAGALAALVQFLLPAAPPPPVPVAEPEAVERPAEPEPPPAPAPAAPAPAPRATAPAPAQLPSDALVFPPAAAPIPAPRAPVSPAPAPQPAPQSQAEAEIARAEESAGPRAVALLDLNTASAAELNRLQGGGAIGRAIVAKRPYASVDQLLAKRVLSRAVYDRIKGQVTVR